MVILDGYYSHVTIEFGDYCETNHIAWYCLPPHSTHILQPLDVGLCSPQHHYSKAVDDSVQRGVHGIYKATSFLYTYKHDMQLTCLPRSLKPFKPVGYFHLIPGLYSTSFNRLKRCSELTFRFWVNHLPQQRTLVK